MTTSDATFAAAIAAIREFVSERDWQQFHGPKNLASAISVEAGELLGHFRWLSAEESVALVAQPTRRAAVASELADVLILTLELCDVLGIDPGRAIHDKLGVNASRYPIDRSKGRHAKYDDL